MQGIRVDSVRAVSVASNIGLSAKNTTHSTEKVLEKNARAT
jgi:hypothetical protein